jgi:hypothetical protein
MGICLIHDKDHPPTNESIGRGSGSHVDQNLFLDFQFARGLFINDYRIWLPEFHP